MVTIAHLVENNVERKPFLEEALAKGIINYAALAEELAPGIEKALKKKVKPAAVMMALRRLAEKLEKRSSKQKIYFRESDITIKSDLLEITVLKSPTIIANIRKVYDMIDFSGGDILTITHGLHEITIISNKRYKQKIQSILEKETIVKMLTGLSSLTIKIPIEALETAGLFYIVTKALNWENINITEIVSTLTEMTLIVREADVGHAFGVLKGVIEEHEK